MSNLTEVMLTPVEVLLMTSMRSNLDTVLTVEQQKQLLLRLQNTYELIAMSGAVTRESYVALSENQVEHARKVLLELNMLIEAFFSDPHFVEKNAIAKSQMVAPETTPEPPPTKPSVVREGNVVSVDFRAARNKSVVVPL